MRQQHLHLSSHDYNKSINMNIRRAFKVIIYFIGISLVAFSIFAIATAAAEYDQRAEGPGWAIGLSLGGLTLIGSTYIFFHRYSSELPLRLSKYFFYILLATFTLIMATGVEIFIVSSFFSPNPSDQLRWSTVGLFAASFIYGVLLTCIAYAKQPLGQQIEESISKILEIMPGNQMAIDDLINHLEHDFKYSEEIIYGHINAMKDLEQFHIPGLISKQCRKKGKNKYNLYFPSLSKIKDPVIKRNIERTIPYLSENMVDIGLFMLGREFETTLKRYLIDAYSKGKLTTTPGNKHPDQLKLAELVSCLKSNNIITDDAALSYLRHQRNERAHGNTPTLGERRLLMNNVEHLASLYIDYIEFIEECRQTL